MAICPSKEVLVAHYYNYYELALISNMSVNFVILITYVKTILGRNDFFFSFLIGVIYVVLFHITSKPMCVVV